MADGVFQQRISIEQVEEGTDLCPKFNDDGLIPVVTTDFDSGELLMVGWMNEEAFRRTIELREAVYWSRSRKALWHKGKHSGFVQHVREIRVDDDQDAVWLRVQVDGGASCHVGYRSCFYRKLDDAPKPALVFTETEKVFDPTEVYAGLENPTKV